MQQSRAVLRAERLSKSFRSPGSAGGTQPTGEIRLFQDLQLEIAAGEMVAVVGESGSGKSSLLHVLAALEKPTSGDVWIGEQRLSSLSPQQAAQLRNREIGYVWQFHYLLPEFTALENVSMPLLARGSPRMDAIAAASTWLAQVGLAGREEHRSGELSGGEQQRVALARALVTGPRVLLADEPTGDLDDRNAEAVFSLLQQLTRERSLATIVVTHNLAFAARCDRTLQLRAGRVAAAKVL